MDIATFQRQIDRVYGEKDRSRGVDATFLWLVEEVGELARALKNDDAENLEEEFADVFAWLTSLASMKGVDLEKAVKGKYGDGCPRCHTSPCTCRHRAPNTHDS